MPASDIKRAGPKVTLPRLKVLEVLEHAEPHHLSAEDVYKNLIDSEDSVGLATVYRVLTQFEAAGMVSRHNFDDGHSVYELASDDGGTIALTAMAALIVAPFMISLGQLWPVLVFGAGIIMIVIEIFAIPGFGVLGLGGIIAVFIGIATMVAPPGGTSGVPSTELWAHLQASQSAA